MSFPVRLVLSLTDGLEIWHRAGEYHVEHDGTVLASFRFLADAKAYAGVR